MGRVSCVRSPSGMLADRFTATKLISIWLLVQYWIFYLDFIWSGNFGSMPLPWWSMLDLIISGTPLSYLIQQWKQVKKTVIFRFPGFLSGVARSHPDVRVQLWQASIHGALAGPIILLLGSLLSIAIFLTREQEWWRNHLADIGGSETEWQEKPSLVYWMLTISW